MDKNFAILRIEKVNTFTALKAMENHWLRKYFTANADPTKKKFNKLIHGALPFEAVEKVLEKKRITKLRKNGILALEFVLTFSPEFIKDASTGKYHHDAKLKLNEWIKLSKSWMLDTFGENCCSIFGHFDEKCPHLHCTVICPELKKNGSYKLNASRIVDGPSKLSKLQSSYHSYVKQLGLSRGIKNTGVSSHQSIKSYYKSLNEAKRVSEIYNLPSQPKDPKDYPNWLKSLKELSMKIDKKTANDELKAEQVIRHLMEANQKLTSQLRSINSDCNQPKLKPNFR